MDEDKKKFYTGDDSDFEREFGGITFTDLDNFEPADEPSEEETYSRKGKKKKKRRKKRYLLRLFIFILLVAAGIFFLRSDFFNIENIKVQNNEHYTEEQIIELSGVKTGENLFEFRTSRVKKRLLKDPYIETAEVNRILPGTLKITVKERVEQIVIAYEDQYIVADLTGMVLRLASEAPELTIINNLDPVEPEPGRALEVKETQVLTDTLDLIKAVEKVGLYFIKISVWQHQVRAYIYQNLVVEGSYDNIIDNIDNLSVVIEDLHNKNITRGTIKVSGNGYCSFQPEVDPIDS